MRTTSILLLLSSSFLVNGSPIAQSLGEFQGENINEEKPAPNSIQQLTPFLSYPDPLSNANQPIVPNTNQPIASNTIQPIAPNTNQPIVPSTNQPIVAPSTTPIPIFTCKFSHSAPDLSIVTGLQQACCSAADDKQCAWYNPANAFCNSAANYRCCEDVYQGVGQGCTTAVDISAKGIYEHVGPDMTSSNIGSPEGNLDLGGPEAELEKSGWLVK